MLPATSSPRLARGLSLSKAAEPSELSLQFRSSKYVTVFANRSTKLKGPYNKRLHNRPGYVGALLLIFAEGSGFGLIEDGNHE